MYFLLFILTLSYIQLAADVCDKVYIEVEHNVYGKRQDEIFFFGKTRTNLIYLSSFLVC